MRLHERMFVVTNALKTIHEQVVARRQQGSQAQVDLTGSTALAQQTLGMLANRSQMQNLLDAQLPGALAAHIESMPL